MGEAELVYGIPASGSEQGRNGVKRKAKIGTFVHGQLKDKRVRFPEFSVYEATRLGSQNIQVMTAKTASMTYINKNFGEDLIENNFQRTYLGAYNPDTGKMEVYDADILKFKPHCPELDEDEVDAAISSDLSYVEQSNLLTSAFGSRRSKKVMETRKKNLVGEETLKKVLDVTIKERTEAAVESQKRLEELVKADASQLSVLPPCNKDATSPEDIYKLSEIISEYEMDVLEEPAQEFFDCDADKINKWREENTYTNFVLKHLSDLPTKDSDSRRYKCKCLLYYHYLVTFYKIPRRSLMKYKDPLPKEWSVTIKNKFLDTFTGPPASVPSASVKGKEYRSFPKNFQERLICYILVMALIFEGYSMHIAELMKDLKIGMRSFLGYFRQIGCVPSNTRKELELVTVTLKAPLVLNKNKAGNKKKPPKR